MRIVLVKKSLFNLYTGLLKEKVDRFNYFLMYLRGLVLLVYQPREVLKKRDFVIRQRDEVENNHLYLSELNLHPFSAIIRQFYRVRT